MNRDIFPLLCDPNDGGDLSLHTFESDVREVREGVLRNDATGRWFPVRDGIPSLFADALRTGALADDDAAFASRHEAKMREAGCEMPANSTAAEGDFSRIEGERRARDEQAADYDRMFSLKVAEKIEAPAYEKALKQLEANRALPLFEAGCGTGRFTEMFARWGSFVVAADMSRDSIVRNRIRHAGKTASPVHYVHCDLTHLPLKDNIFGTIAHCGVYEHIPSRSMREQFLAHAARVCQKNGVLVLSAYRWDGMGTRWEKEGEHDGGIPYFRFTEAELRAEVEPYFSIEKFQGNLAIYLSLVAGRPLHS
ncbi:MAG TPA: methyltransferase domain-containing protein [Abditibacteriaceae bacterium]|jgi:SAM-dependent methyltransferase/uncharacterized protein YbaR (Trm112 family)